ncbi:hypothetical protein ILUMI_17238 [Ignelater luminosus]|uniref:Uncharacterized protein n=1 Tax=Ignelater luminosus TaxID=2038154 RepID=A0A8K0CKG7_IGNLU|nr:hypothetical protein ILUMI_17238 [Ignelater luminosus]
MSRSWRIVQMARLQNEDTVDSSEFLNSTELNNKECGQIASTNEIPVDAHLFSYPAVPDISAFQILEPPLNPNKLEICSLPIVVIDEQGMQIELSDNNCIITENGSELEVVNTTTPEIIKDNYFQLEQESSAININKIHISQILSADLENSIQLEIDNSTKPKLIENNFYLVQESPEENTDNNKVKRKSRKRNLESWTTTDERKKRESGDKYLGKKKDTEGNWMYDVQRKNRKMKVRCNCKLSRNKKVLMCSSVSDDQQKKIFTEFWAMSWKEKRLYIQMLCDFKRTQRARNRKDIEKSRRSISMNYYLKVEKDRVKVCKNMFLNTLCIASIRPGKRIGDPTVTDLRALKYNPNGTIQYKLRFGDAWQNLPLRMNNITAIPFAELPALYKERLPINNEKFNHLQILKNELRKRLSRIL